MAEVEERLDDPLQRLQRKLEEYKAELDEVSGKVSALNKVQLASFENWRNDNDLLNQRIDHLMTVLEGVSSERVSDYFSMLEDHQQRMSASEELIDKKLEPLLKVIQDLGWETVVSYRRISEKFRDQDEIIEYLSRLDAERKDMARIIYATTNFSDDDDVQFKRFFPVRVYLSEGEPLDVSAVTEALWELGEELGFEESVTYPAERGSWFGRFFGKTTTDVAKAEAAEIFNKGKRALELASVDKLQAEANSKNSDAVAKLIAACENQSHVALQIGTLVYIKYSKPDGQVVSLVKTLTQKQLIALEKDSSLLSNPENLLLALNAENERDGNLGGDNAMPPPMELT